MSPDDWKKAEVLFDAAIELASKDRKAYLDAHDGGDALVRLQVENLLASDTSAGDFIESPVWTDSSVFSTSDKLNISVNISERHFPDKYIGGTIGQYRIISELGCGGMGSVYLAERSDGEFEQRVAIKLIKRGMGSDFIIQRFRHERQILASLEHPFIGRLLDGGTTADGEPYFVMEHITGETLFDHCDHYHLDITERLALFRKICSAIKYAHERLIIHRDIKPGNIIINRSGEPKLLDFGIAKILDPDLIHESINPTASMLRMMTPDYASPEQMQGSEITAQSDIYSLGILLFELITGHKPYVFDIRSLKEVSHAICEIPAEIASKAIELDVLLMPRYKGDRNAALMVRKTSRSELHRILEGDLDNIIAKTLSKDPAERYRSVGELSVEIGRYLNGVPANAPKALAFAKNFTALPVDNITIAVLPFTILSIFHNGESDDRYLTIGMADALITRLSKNRKFSVRPTSSVLRYNETLIDPVMIGKELNVDYILVGNIKHAGDRIRVTVQLLKVKENSTVWAHSIDETDSHLLILEDTIAAKVVDALVPHLNGSDRTELAKRGTNDAKAFEHYLRGRFYFNSFTEDGLARSFVSFHNAIASDPNYAAAYSGIADYYTWLGIIGVLPPQECFQPAIATASKAIELDPELSDPYASLGFSLHAGNFNWSEGEHHLRHAIQLNNSNANAFAWIAIVLYTQGRFDEGLAAARHAVELDPVTPFKHHNIGWGLYFARRYDEAAAQYERVIRDFPDYGFGHYGLSKIYRRMGETKLSLEESRLAVTTMGDSVFAKLNDAESLAADGQIEAAKIKLSELIQMSTNRYVSPYQIALIYCHLAENTDTAEQAESIENAFSCLEQAYEAKDAWMNWLGVEPGFDILRGDRRFHEILERIGYNVFLYNFNATNSSFNDLTISGSTHNKTTLLIDQEKSTHEFQISRTKIFFHKKLALIAAAGLLIAICVFGLYRFGYFGLENSDLLTDTFTTNEKRVVVLPFSSSDPQAATIGTGLADALSQKLGNIKAIEVISANSGRNMAPEDLASIRESLGANYVLRGTMENNLNTAVVTAEFIETKSGKTIWQQTFEASDGNLFKLQTLLAEKIWTSLGIEPLPLELQMVEKSYTNDPKAYEFYLIGRFQQSNRSASDIRKAIISFSESIKLDPNFAPAYVGLSDSYSLLNLYDIDPPADAYQKASEYAQYALKIDPNLAEAHASLAYVKFYHERDRQGAELEFRRSIQLNPSYAQAHHWFALALAGMDDPLKALEEIRIAERLDPNSLAVRSAAGMVLFFNGKYQEAIKECDAALSLDQNFIPALKVKRWIYSAQNDRSAAAAIFSKEITYSGGDSTNPGWQIIAAQVQPIADSSKFIETLNAVVASSEIRDNPLAYAYEVALAFNALGDKAQAIKYLEIAEQAGSHGFNFASVDPRLDDLRNDERFQKLIYKLERPINP